MTSRLFIVDILVNATGATLLLFFLFIVRLNPGSAEAEPRSEVRPILVVDVRVEESARLAEVSALLGREKEGMQEEVLHILPPQDMTDSTAKFEVFPEPVPGMFGAWGATRLHDDTLRLVVPCPRPGEEWTLRLVHPAAGIFPRPTEPLETDVTLRLIAPGEGSDIDESTGVLSDSEPLTGSFNLSPETDTEIAWTTELDRGCD